jgi:hypothetical protein
MKKDRCTDSKKVLKKMMCVVWEKEKEVRERFEICS